jgi:hypothetical protein
MNDSLLFAVATILLLAFAGGLTSARNRYRIRRRH